MPVWKLKFFILEKVSSCFFRRRPQYSLSLWPGMGGFFARNSNRRCPGPDSNRHGRLTNRGILSPLCLPIPPPGRGRDSLLDEKRDKNKKRPGGESNPRIRVLQTPALPLGYQA